jgi:hypothetical protein
MIDHMHLIEPSNVYRGRKVDEISEITKGAKRLAKRLVPVVLLAQLSRDLEKREDQSAAAQRFPRQRLDRAGRRRSDRHPPAALLPQPAHRKGSGERGDPRGRARAHREP